ncbi:MAG: isoprenylcysteine carboxylmethyltransferase family protein [Bacteroidetes bacterium]|nr:isoprenylcysteine carboxylmethyltransferase family protein [Bacteroidota bacterium]MDA1119292.1 isoprenylcysteine carboxylmethyltransferase family protein [Bacteroidota bacterium]
MNDILKFILMWLVYFSLHSFMASIAFKKIILNLSPWLHQNYRIFYNLVSILGLLYILLMLATTPSDQILTGSPILKFLGLALATWGIIFLKLSFKEYSIREFLGIKKETQGKQLSLNGILKQVRHPIYTGTILIVSGFFLFNPKMLNLVTLICVVIYIIIGIQLEEQKLEMEFGDDYRKYKEKVPMLVPRFKR